jgi:broad specificity phosphatase PhoE
MTTFYICRHGETENNKNRRFSGWIDTPLTAAGLQDAKSSAAKLKGAAPDKIISSDLGRTFITAYIIARELEHTAEITRAKELREVNYGDFAYQSYSVYPNTTPAENTNFVSPNGESLAQMQRRVVDYIRKVSADNPNKAVLLVAHHGTINAVRSWFSGEEMGVTDLTHNAHDFAGSFTCRGDKISMFEELK